MDVSEFPNPYDFANPVVEEKLFVGRTNEMNEIRYYLDHATRASRPIHLAVIGERASGKTSVLNMIQIEAQKRQFCVVRVDLDEADAETQLAFFYKIFDSILTTACKLGVFEGIAGKTYECYRNMVDAYEIPEDKTFCSFIFPMQYANAMGKGNVTASLSDTGFKEDMSTIRMEVGRPIGLLLDECDVLAKSRVHLEKLRNIFMNTPGFMLVVTGTTALFPLMDEVFSPIIRQFKRISIGPFEKEYETEECVRKPLENIGIPHPSEIFDFDTYRDVREIHSLAGGRPYEIQLVCHFLFRRVQRGSAKRMELTLDVLDEVLEELRESQDISLRPVLAAIQKLDRQHLSALSLLCACNGRAEFEQIWFIEYVVQGEKEWTKESLQERLRRLEEVGVIKIKNQLVGFAGDDFDRIYFKYLAKRHGIPWYIGDQSFEIFLSVRFDSLVVKEAKGVRGFPFVIVGLREELQIEEIAMALSDESENANPFTSAPHIAEIVYWSSLDFRESDHFEIASVTVAAPWTAVQFWYGCEGPKRAKECSLDDLRTILAEPSERAAATGGNLRVEIHSLAVIPVETLARKVERAENIRIKNRLANMHYLKMIEAYLKQGDIEEAVFHGEFAYRYEPEPARANNLGYLWLVSDDLQRARVLLEEAARNYEESEDRALPNYNLGVVDAKEGKLERALTQFKLVMEQIEHADTGARRCLCLVLPYVDEEDQLAFRELQLPDLLETARSAASAVQQLLSKE